MARIVGCGILTTASAVDGLGDAAGQRPDRRRRDRAAIARRARRRKSECCWTGSATTTAAGPHRRYFPACFAAPAVPCRPRRRRKFDQPERRNAVGARPRPWQSGVVCVILRVSGHSRSGGCCFAALALGARSRMALLTLRDLRTASAARRGGRRLRLIEPGEISACSVATGPANHAVANLSGKSRPTTAGPVRPASRVALLPQDVPSDIHGTIAGWWPRGCRRRNSSRPGKASGGSGGCRRGDAHRGSKHSPRHEAACLWPGLRGGA